MSDYYPDFSDLWELSSWEGNKIEELAIKKARLVLYNSYWAARSAIKDYGTDPSKVHIVNFGGNFQEIPLKEAVLSKKKTETCRLLFLETDWARKGGDLAVETFLALRKMGFRAELTVCGFAPPKNLSYDGIKTAPFLDKNDEQQRKRLIELFSGADILLFPTRADCASVVIAEANAFGLPAIATNTGGIPSVVREGENGFMLPLSATGKDYAKLIHDLYQDDERYYKLVKTSREVYERRLNWDTWGQAVKEIMVKHL